VNPRPPASRFPLFARGVPPAGLEPAPRGLKGRSRGVAQPDRFQEVEDALLIGFAIDRLLQRLGQRRRRQCPVGDGRPAADALPPGLSLRSSPGLASCGRTDRQPSDRFSGGERGSVFEAASTLIC
jgi:hypothetical protein